MLRSVGIGGVHLERRFVDSYGRSAGDPINTKRWEKNDLKVTLAGVTRCAHDQCDADALRLRTRRALTNKYDRGKECTERQGRST